MNIARKFYYSLTPASRLWARRIFYFPYDLYTSIIRGKRNPMVPPRGMIFIGSGDFVRQGEHLADLAITYTKIQPNGKILDIGCGIGRLAVPLTKYLDKEGRYEGFDIVKLGIDWCTRNISSKYPNFRFICVDLKNDLYNLDTQKEAKEFVFPYPENYFDSVILTSVFTHMMPTDVKHYLEQIALVLKNGGKCLATFFIINKRVEDLMASNRSHFVFKYSYEGCFLMHSTVKEANVAFEENFLRSMISDCGLSIDAIYPGNWSDKSKDALDFQDIVILKK